MFLSTAFRIRMYIVCCCLKLVWLMYNIPCLRLLIINIWTQRILIYIYIYFNSSNRPCRFIMKRHGCEGVWLTSHVCLYCNELRTISNNNHQWSIYIYIYIYRRILASITQNIWVSRRICTDRWSYSKSMNRGIIESIVE